jgi:hypothetical protein
MAIARVMRAAVGDTRHRNWGRSVGLAGKSRNVVVSFSEDPAWQVRQDVALWL